ncbi:hypothetical protein C6499_05175 [Candidatus Poribacteria bacterium]|nr:MAG: hypothetical protein C6499_05175 [Candidatus Poribacteria bacterium]
MMKKKPSKFLKPDVSDKKIAVAASDAPPSKKEKGPVPAPDYTLEELLENIPEPDVSDKKAAIAASDVPPSKKKKGPVPAPDYTLEELLENIPEPSSKGPEPGSSGEVDTGEPVGEEIW